MKIVNKALLLIKVYVNKTTVWWCKKSNINLLCSLKQGLLCTQHCIDKPKYCIESKSGWHTSVNIQQGFQPAFHWLANDYPILCCNPHSCQCAPKPGKFHCTFIRSVPCQRQTRTNFNPTHDLIYTNTNNQKSLISSLLSLELQSSYSSVCLLSSWHCLEDPTKTLCLPQNPKQFRSR